MLEKCYLYALVCSYFLKIVLMFLLGRRVCIQLLRVCWGLVQTYDSLSRKVRRHLNQRAQTARGPQLASFVKAT